LVVLVRVVAVVDVAKDAVVKDGLSLMAVVAVALPYLVMVHIVCAAAEPTEADVVTAVVILSKLTNETYGAVEKAEGAAVPFTVVFAEHRA